MRRYSPAVALFMAVPAGCLPSPASYSDEAVVIGGPVVAETGGLEMLERDIILRPDMAVMRVLFRNRTAQDVDTSIAVMLSGATGDVQLLVRQQGDVRQPADDGLPGGREKRLSWRQLFPAGDEVEIELRVLLPPPAGRPMAQDVRRYCLDLSATAATAGVQRVVFRMAGTGYWPSPVKRFALSVETAGDDPQVASCYPGLQRRRPGLHEVGHRDFMPLEDAQLLLMHGIGRQP